MIYTACFVKNIDSINRTYLGKELAPDEEYQIPDNLRDKWATDNSVLTDIVSEKIQIGNGTIYCSTFTEQIAWIRNEYLMTETKVTSSTPFAEPLYRTKYNATEAWATVNVNESATNDFLLTEERYVAGGQLIIKNAEEGDYITAEVRDVNDTIPEQYRAALCEAHPIVATYIQKWWINPNAQCTTVEVDTTPLNAKISAGLYLRIIYYAVNSGSARKIAINYKLTKKL